MLQLYDLNKVKIKGLNSCKDCNIESTLSSGDKILSFSYPANQCGDILEEYYIRTKTSEFVVKEISGSGDWKNIKAILNLEELEGKEWESFDTTEQTVTDCLNLALVDTGWTVQVNNVTKKRTIRKTNCSTLDIINQVKKTYLVEIEFDTINKIVKVCEKLGSDKGVYFMDSLNLRNLEVQRNSYDFYTRILAIGKDDLKVVVENFQYSNKKKTLIWKDERYTNLESLTEDATFKLSFMAKPYKSYAADVIDLANISNKYSILSYGLGDTITLISKDEKIRDKQRIVKMVEYLDEPELNTCEIANTILSFEDTQEEFEETSDTVNNITTDNGTIDGSTIDSIETEQIRDFDINVVRAANILAINADIQNLRVDKADIQSLNAVTARIGNLETTTATITQLNASVARIDDLYVTKATIIDLRASNAKIDTLEVKAATIDTQLSKTIATTNLNAENIISINATVKELTTGKANISDLSATNANISNLNATVGNINTLLAGNLSAINMQTGFITAGSGLIANGAIKDAMILNCSVNKLLAGDISTNKFRIVSTTGNMLISDNTIQIKDASRVRVQIGKDASNDYNMYVWDSSGNLMFDATGLKASGIKSKIIRDDMVSDTANIQGTKLDINSVVTSINGATTLLKATKVKLDTEAQTLDVAFTSLKSTVTSTANTVSNQGTAITAIQGQISSKIWSSDITTAVDNIQVGGRNLLLNSKGSFKLNPSNTGTESDEYNFWIFNKFSKPLELNKEYTISLEVEKTDGSYESVTIYDYPGGDMVGIPIINNKIQRTFTKKADTVNSILVYAGVAGRTRGNGIILKNVKIEEGTKATSWTPAPEDTDAQITTINNNYSTLTQTISGINTAVGSLNTKINTTNGNVVSVDNKVTTLSQTVDGIKTTVSSVQTNYLTKTDAGATYATNTKVTTLEQTVNGISATVSNVQSTVNSQGTTISDHTTKISAMDGVIKLKVDTTTYNTKMTSIDGSINTINTSLTKATSDISILQGQIALKVTQTDIDKSISNAMNTVDQKIDSANAEINILKNQIVLKVETSTFNSTVTTINSTATSNLTTAKSYADTKKSEAISTASTDATTKANTAQANAINSAKGYTDTQIITVTSRLTTSEQSISILQGQIALKVTQTDIDKSISSIEIGGRNYVKKLGGTVYDINSIYGEDIGRVSFETISNKKWIKYTGYGRLRINSIAVEPNMTYTWSFNIYTTGTGTEISCSEYDGTGYGSKYYTISKTAIRISHTFTTKSTSTYEIFHIGGLGTSDIYYFSDFKLEKGNKATDYTVAPEDVDQAINTVDQKITTKTSEINTTINGITSRVSSTETSISIINGNVTNLTTRISSAEQKISSDSIISTVTSSSNYRNDLNSKEGSIIKSGSAPSNPATGQLWLDTSKTPEVLQRWSGSTWYRITPTQASDVGAYTKGETETKITQLSNSITSRVSSTETSISIINGNVTNLTTRISSAEQKISSDSIISTVTSSSNYRNDLNSKEGSIIKSGSAPSNPATGQLWLDTSKTPEVLQRWSGSTWYRITPTQASDVGAYTKGETETKITQLSNSISSKVSTNDLSSLIEQRASSVQIAFNKISSNINNSAGMFTIKNGAMRIYNGRNNLAFSVGGDGHSYFQGKVQVACEPGVSQNGDDGTLLANGNGSVNMHPYGFRHESFISQPMRLLSNTSEFHFKTLDNRKFGTVKTWAVNPDYVNVQYNDGGSSYLYANTINSNVGSLWLNYYAGNKVVIGAGTSSSNYGPLECKDFKAYGTKNAVIKTEHHGDLAINAYETAEYYSGDIGSGKLENGECVIWIDDIFGETINTNVAYQVFLSKYGKGDIWVSERHSNYFIVQGDNDIEFGWELKAKRLHYENVRLTEINKDDMLLEETRSNLNLDLEMRVPFSDIESHLDNNENNLENILFEGVI